MKEKGYVLAGSTAEITSGRPKALKVKGESVVLFCADGRYFAVRNRCPHQQFEKLHEGEVVGTVVTCPMHGWSFDLASGKSLTGEGRLTTYGILVENGSVFVECDGEG